MLEINLTKNIRLIKTIWRTGGVSSLIIPRHIMAWANLYPGYTIPRVGL